MSTENEGWRRNADTNKMRPEDVERAGVQSKRPPGQHSGEVLHQRRSLPFSITGLAVAGFLLAAGIGFFTLYMKAKPEATATNVAKTTAGTPNGYQAAQQSK